ncbi:hypothetical protein AXG93_2490s1410 [Marchantia polymorpha subsp. ruderalis]|uniref:Uncharacterized protein n=1 Tax=Marchantia polymorpha subsp. ruderalis TaxID=1480154 RepID=A0A176W5P1_MARPO|nr:hypothetical protein AXG93_2490s1410 [Marchantia polymorpha subsp. ruderalis]
MGSGGRKEMGIGVVVVDGGGRAGGGQGEKGESGAAFRSAIAGPRRVLCHLSTCCVGVGGGAAPRLGWTGWGLGLGLWWRCSLEWAQKQVSGFGVGRGGEWEEADRGFVCRKQEELRTRRSDAGSDMQFLTRGVSVGRNRVFSYEAVCCRGSKEGAYTDDLYFLSFF